MFRTLELTPEEEEEIIRRVAEKITEYGMSAAAVLLLQTFKPMAFLGGQTGRFFIGPLLYGLGDKISLGAEKLFMVFEKRDNIEKLIRMLEQRAEEETRKREEAERRETKGAAGGPLKRLRSLFGI